MLRLALASFISLVGVACLASGINRLRFRGRIAREARELWEREPAPRAIDRDRLQALPSPVRSYLAKAIGERTASVASVRFRHGGRFRPKLDGPWRPIRGEQYGSADPPGFLWWGRLRVAPGVWIDARDRCVNAMGAMLVSLESSVTLADRAGAEMDQGSMLRLLSELVLLPSAFLDGRHVTWTAVDDGNARAMLRVNGREVAGVFAFGADALPRAFSSERYLDTGAGRPELRTWSGEYADYRAVAGLLVPHRLLGYWNVDGRRVPYVDFVLDAPEYNVRTPF
jgi:uncharacterized protein DUF6544